MDHGNAKNLPLSLISIVFVFAMIVGARPGRAFGADQPLEISFKDHHFTPLSLTVPAGQPLKIRVVNTSNETIEFESFKLNREQVVTPGETITVKLPALS